MTLLGSTAAAILLESPPSNDSLVYTFNIMEKLLGIPKAWTHNMSTNKDAIMQYLPV